MQKSIVATILLTSIVFSQISVVQATSVESELFFDTENNLQSQDISTTLENISDHDPAQFIPNTIISEQGKFTSEQKSYNTSKGHTDDIGYGIDDSRFKDDFDKMIKAIRKAKNSGSEKQSIEEMISNALVNYSQASNNMTGDSLEDYITGKLNSQEQILYKNNRTKALLCISNGKLAIDYSKELYQSPVLHNGNGDAFRHILWNYGMAQDVGQDFAKQWSDAHEYGSINAPQLEKNMDLHNNSIGLALSRENPWTVLHSTFKNNSRQAVRSGRAVIISGTRLIKSSNYGEK